MTLNDISLSNNMLHCTGNPFVFGLHSPKHSETERVYNLLQLAKEKCLTAVVLGVLLAEAFGFVWNIEYGIYCPG